MQCVYLVNVVAAFISNGNDNIYPKRDIDTDIDMRERIASTSLSSLFLLPFDVYLFSPPNSALRQRKFSLRPAKSKGAS